MNKALVMVFASLSLMACVDDSPTGGGGAGGGGGTEPEWQVVFDDGALDRALLSIWGTSSQSVYAVGGPLKNDGFEAIALHYDGTNWVDLEPGGTSSFWWVHGLTDNDVWLVGENGRITHFDGTSFTEMDSGTTATLWGVIAFAADDVWAVGGEVGGPSTQPDDVVLHYDGVSWSQEVLPGEPLNRAHFKVWGTSNTDLFIVGEAGVIWHRGPAGWLLQSETPVATGNLTTVHGCSSTDAWAVGGRDLLHYDGAAWQKLDKVLGNDVNGVFCESTDHVAIVGMGGLKQRYDGTEWADDFAKDPHGNLHGIWIDDTGALWAVGGDFISSPKPNTARNGIIAHYGTSKIPSTFRE